MLAVRTRRALCQAVATCIRVLPQSGSRGVRTRTLRTAPLRTRDPQGLIALATPIMSRPDVQKCLCVSAVASAVTAAAAAAALFLPEVECESPETEQELARLCGQGDHAAVSALLKKGTSPNSRHLYGWTALHAASVRGDARMCELLLEAGADPDLEDSFNPRSSSNREQYWRQLSDRQKEFSEVIDPAADTRGFTALHYACLAPRGSLKVIDVLQRFHANPTIKEKSGHVAADYADQKLKRRMEEFERDFAQWREEEKVKHEAAAREQRRLFPLEARVKQKLVGQDGPINAVAAAIRRRENGWHDDEHPLVFLFLGSSGLGKTELAKQVASYIHSGDREGFIRIDMTEYQSKHEAAKFIGSPPGYVGYEEGGQLTKLLAERPNAVVLLDEVEKAHPDVLNLMLQLFDEGRITDGQGKTIECKDAIFVMTSNLASDEIAEHGVELRREAALLGTPDETVAISKAFKANTIRPILKAHFQRDEFLGRIDEMLYFLPFSSGELRQLVQQQLKKWAEKAQKRHEISLSWDDSVLDLISAEYDVHYGARSLQHAVDQLVVNRLAQSHEEGSLQPGGTAHLTVDGDQIAVSSTAPKSGGKSWRSILG